MSQPLLTASHLSFSFDSRILFDDVSLSIHAKDRFALIGENGSGKTTLFKLLGKALAPTAGEIIYARDLTIGLLPQEVIVPEDVCVRAYLEEGRLKELEKEMALCLEDPNQLNEWDKLHHEYESLGGYRQLPLEKILQGLHLKELLEEPMQKLSSGQRVRIALAKALLSNPNLLLLDEPTNHLDEEMCSWLETTLLERTGATVLISHDRRFLNRVCNHLVEIRDHKLNTYSGNYDDFLHEQDKILERRLAAFEEQKQKKAQLKEKIKAMTFSKGKAKPASDRNVMAYDRRGELHQKSTKHALDTLKAQLKEIEANPLSHPKPKTIKGLYFSPTPLATNLAIEIHELSMSFNNQPLFSNLSHTLHKKDRILLIGPNGCGKTTLLRCIAGQLLPDSGSISRAATAKIGFLEQEVERLPSPHFDLSEEGLRRELHKAALGGPELLLTPFEQLSVGQRKRLHLLSLLLQKPNVLLLDEPTNHLDLLTVEALEKALLSFEGAILAVSHDPTFIDKIATDTWLI